MSDSSSFTSLLALVNSHLSKTSVQESRSENAGNSTGIPIPTLGEGNSITQSDTKLALSPGQRLPIPRFTFGNSPIDDDFAAHLLNMPKAKELKRQEEEQKKKLEEEMERLKLEEENNVIDLLPAVQNPNTYRPEPKEEIISNSSSLESLFEPNFIDCDVEPEKPKTPVPLLPCCTDISYILKEKIKFGKCSSFGRVLVAKYRPVAAPYLAVKIDSSIERFDFSTPSPCDINKERMKKPSCYNAYSVDVFSSTKVPT